VLDIGAGTGRNTLPWRARLSDRRHRARPALAQILREEVEKEKLPSASTRVTRSRRRGPSGTALSARVPCGGDRFAHSQRREVRSCSRAPPTRSRRAGSCSSTHFSRDGYRPDALVREMSQVFWCNVVHARRDRDGDAGAPFEFLSDESTHDYELRASAEGRLASHGLVRGLVPRSRTSSTCVREVPNRASVDWLPADLGSPDTRPRPPNPQARPAELRPAPTSKCPEGG
jgi:hypothetical protein